MKKHPVPTPRVSLFWRLVLSALQRLPQGALSRLFGALADIPLPRWARRPVLGSFARLVGATVAEAEKPLDDYPSLNAFFVRRLRPGARVWPSRPDLISSPVDGVIGEHGRIENGTLFQAKGITYSAAELLGGDPEQAEVYEGGLFITLYLAPRHYHRIHTPMAGHVIQARHVPGRLLPVNAAAVGSIEGLFSRNERLICTLAGALGPLAVVAVGAYNVGRISAAFDSGWSGRAGGSITNRGALPPDHRRYRDPIPVGVGDELMAFHLGSTVILLTGPGVTPEPNLHAGGPVRAGQVLAGCTVG